MIVCFAQSRQVLTTQNFLEAFKSKKRQSVGNFPNGGGVHGFGGRIPNFYRFLDLKASLIFYVGYFHRVQWPLTLTLINVSVKYLLYFISYFFFYYTSDNHHYQGISIYSAHATTHTPLFTHTPYQGRFENSKPVKLWTLSEVRREGGSDPLGCPNPLK